jgi:hypothetical protein
MTPAKNAGVGKQSANFAAGQGKRNVSTQPAPAQFPIAAAMATLQIDLAGAISEKTGALWHNARLRIGRRTFWLAWCPEEDRLARSSDSHTLGRRHPEVLRAVEAELRRLLPGGAP